MASPERRLTAASLNSSADGGTLFLPASRLRAVQRTNGQGAVLGRQNTVVTSNAVMLFVPFSLEHAHLNAWAHAGEVGRHLDGAAYFSSFGFVWDGVWIAPTLLNWRVLTLA